MPNHSYYDDSEGGAPTATNPEPGGDESGASGNGQTTLLPKSVFGGRELNPGDKCEFEVVRVQEDAYEVKPLEGAPEEEKPQQPAESPEDGGDEGGGGMSGMME